MEITESPGDPPLRRKKKEDDLLPVEASFDLAFPRTQARRDTRADAPEKTFSHEDTGRLVYTRAHRRASDDSRVSRISLVLSSLHSRPLSPAETVFPFCSVSQFEFGRVYLLP